MKGEHEPDFLHSLLTFGGVVVMVIVGLLWFGISLHSLLLVALIWVAGNAAALGLRFKSIKTAMSAGIEKGLGAIYIFILIGVLVAALIEGGTIGSLIYYGVDLLHPSIFLPTGLLLCTLMSLATGTSWGTIATIGVVLVGLGGALGIPLPIVAGMVVSGASFGDKMSPVSDTTVLAAMSPENRHLRSHTFHALYVRPYLHYLPRRVLICGHSICRADALRRGINRTPGRHLTRIRYQPAGPATASTIPVFEMPAKNINKLVTHAGRRNSGRGPFTPGVGDDSLD